MTLLDPLADPTAAPAPAEPASITFTVEVLHNRTTVAQAVADGHPANAWLAADLPARAASPAPGLRAHMRDEHGARRPRIVPGDRLHRVVTLQLPAPSAQWAAEAAFVASEAPYDVPGQAAYYAHATRAIVPGDVVVVHTPDGPVAYACAGIGWDIVDLADYTVTGREG